MEEQIYNALDVAKYIVISSNNQNIPITNLRLQKMLYYIKHFYLNRHNRVLFNNIIEAWDYGPVLPDVYREFKQWGGFRIPSNSFDFNDSNITQLDRNILDRLVNLLSEFPTNVLVEDSHKHMGWNRAINDLFNNQITDEEIRNFYG